MPPDAAVLAYELRELRRADNEWPRWEHIGAFTSAAALKRAVLSLLGKCSARHIHLDCDERSITLVMVDTGRHLEIVRRWRAHESEEWQRAPWAAHSVRALRHLVRDWIVAAMPDAQFYQFDLLANQFVPTEPGREVTLPAV